VSYCPDESVLGNPGVFGFIESAVSKVGAAIGGVVKSVTGGQPIEVKFPGIPQPQIVVQSPPPQVKLPEGWLMPALIGGGFLLVLLLGKRR
jgi:hypothetical protein